MSSLERKVDFAVVVGVSRANPNGDPLNGNRPRVNFDGHGEITDVCLKRKIRNRLIDAGHPIFVQSADHRVDQYGSLKERVVGELGKDVLESDESLRKAACERWIDVRAFGQVFAYKGTAKKKKKTKVEDTDSEQEEEADAVSVGVRGPVSLHSAFSVSPVTSVSTQITKSVNNEGEGTKRGSDTVGMKHRIDHGLYMFYGSMNPQLAVRTGFSDEDALAIKEALRTLFENDASTARPEGSMEVHKLIWWNHNCRNGQYPSAKVHRSLKVAVKLGITEPKCYGDYDIVIEPLLGLATEIVEGQ